MDALEAALQPPGMVVAATTLFGDALVELDNGSRVMTLNAPTTPDDLLAAAPVVCNLVWAGRPG